MINIIKHEIPPIARFKCEVCGCVWKAGINDGSCERLGQIKTGIGNVRGYTMVCPTCGSGIIIIERILKSDVEGDENDP